MGRQADRDWPQLLDPPPMAFTHPEARRRQVGMGGLKEDAPMVDRQLPFEPQRAAFQQEQVVAVDHRQVLVIDCHDRRVAAPAQQLRPERPHQRRAALQEPRREHRPTERPQPPGRRKVRMADDQLDIRPAERVPKRAQRSQAAHARRRGGGRIGGEEQRLFRIGLRDVGAGADLEDHGRGPAGIAYLAA